MGLYLSKCRAGWHDKHPQAVGMVTITPSIDTITNKTFSLAVFKLKRQSILVLKYSFMRYHVVKQDQCSTGFITVVP